MPVKVYLGMMGVVLLLGGATVALFSAWPWVSMVALLAAGLVRWVR